MARGKARVHGPYRHGNKWRVHFVTTGPGGDRTTTYETFTSRADAQKCADGASDEAQGITVSKAIEAYLGVVRARGRAELTAIAYASRLRVFLGDYLSRPVRSIQRRGPELYAAAVVGRKADSHHSLLTAARIWAKWCVRQGWLKENPFADIELVGQRVHGADKAQLTVDESRQLEAWCLAHPQDIGAVVTLGYLYLGPRNNELACRDIRDLDDGGTLLRIGKTKTKAGRRKLRIPEALAEMLREIAAGRAGDEPLFRNVHGRRMLADVARRHVVRVCKLAGVPELTPQALRRTHATMAIEAGESGLAVARHLGHATGAAPAVTTKSYVATDATAAAEGERVLRVIRGGRS